jgi:hypothetical protein
LKELIDGGRLPRPKRSFRFIWVPEWYGTMAYIDAHPELTGPELGGKFLANMNMDMVGENLELLHSKMIITRTPLSIPSCVNDVVENMAHTVAGLNVRTPRGSLSQPNIRITPYSGGSDHMMFIDRKIPGIMFGHSPDYTHHTSEDTPDKVDPVELERTEIIATGAAWYLANLDATQAADLARLSLANGMQRLYEQARRAQANQPPSPSAAVDLAGMQNIIDHGFRDALLTVSSVLNFNNDETVRFIVDDATKQLEAAHRALSVGPTSLYPRTGSPGKNVSGAEARVPERTTRGPLDFGLPESKLSAEQSAWYSTPRFTISGEQRFELVNFIDGRRNVSEIRDAITAFSHPVNVRVVYRYLDDLVKAGVVRWKE